MGPYRGLSFLDNGCAHAVCKHRGKAFPAIVFVGFDADVYLIGTDCCREGNGAHVFRVEGYVAEAVRQENAGIIRAMIEQNRNMQDFLRRTMPRSVLLDTGLLVGELTPAIDNQLADRLEHTRRGNTR